MYVINVLRTLITYRRIHIHTYIHTYRTRGKKKEKEGEKKERKKKGSYSTQPPSLFIGSTKNKNGAKSFGITVPFHPFRSAAFPVSHM